MSTRAQTVVLSLRDKILNGHYAPGARLNEIELSTALAVSRTPVRAALAILAAEGLLDYVPNSGYVVRSYTANDIEGVYAARSVLEGLAARTVAETGLSSGARGLLHQILTETETIAQRTEWTEATHDTWRRLNEQFHESRSIPLLKTVKFRWHDAQTVKNSFTDHAELFDAIARGQSARAEHLAREHVYQAGRRLVANWRKAGIGENISPRQNVSDAA